MAKKVFTINVKEINYGFVEVEADTLEEAFDLAGEQVELGETAWNKSEIQCRDANEPTRCIPEKIVQKTTHGNIVAELGGCNENYYPSIHLYLITGEGENYKDRSLATIEVNGDKGVGELRALVWADLDTEDYTHEIKLADPVKKYDLGFGCMGNGITVYNRAEERNYDYVTVAHIRPDRTVKLYDNNLPDDVRQTIEKVARESEGSELEQKTFEVRPCKVVYRDVTTENIVSGFDNVSEPEFWSVYRNGKEDGIRVQLCVRDFDKFCDAKFFCDILNHKDDSFIRIPLEEMEEELEYREQAGIDGPGCANSGTFTCGWNDNLCQYSTEELMFLASLQRKGQQSEGSQETKK